MYVVSVYITFVEALGSWRAVWDWKVFHKTCDITCLKQKYWEVSVKVTESYPERESFMFCSYLFLKHVKEKKSKPLSLGNVNQFKKCRIFMEGIVQNLEDMENTGMNAVWGTKLVKLSIVSR